jgi:AraC-like DNA-binding protein
MKYKKVRLAPGDADKYLNRLLHFMDSEKPYLDPSLSLAGLHKRTGIPEHYLSQVINGKLNRNFFDFINRYRIREACRILADSGNHKSIIQVAFEVGFNSKSAFNRAFNKHVQMTPSDFKKAQRDSRKQENKESPAENVNPSLVSRLLPGSQTSEQ